MTPRSVVVTGLGVTTALGCDLETIWEAICQGRTASTYLVDHGFRGVGPLWAMPVPRFEPSDYVRDRKALRFMDRGAAFGFVAATRAGADAGFDTGAGRGGEERVGVFVGSPGRSFRDEDFAAAVSACSRDGSLSLRRFGTDGLPLIDPKWLLKGLANIVLFAISETYGALGTNTNITLGGVSATLAIAEAVRAIQRGHLDVAFAGGYDCLLEEDKLKLLRSSGLLTDATAGDSADGPFGSGRNGFVPGEGAAFVVIEEDEHAHRRGARIYAEIAGFGSCVIPADTWPVRACDGFASALTAALGASGRSRPSAVFAHGLGTLEIDQAEVCALKRVLGNRTPRVAVAATKSIFGHIGCGAGALDVALGCMSLQRNSLPAMPDHLAAVNGLRWTSDANRVWRGDVIAACDANLAGCHAATVLRRAASQ